MKINYLEKLIRSFVHFDYSKRLIDRIHNWMVEEDGWEEKDRVLHSLWKETKPKSDIDTERSFRGVMNRLGIESGYIPDSFNRRWMWKLVAAVTIGIIFSSTLTLWLSYNTWNRDDSIMTEQYACLAERKTFLLPDGTQVCLNAASHVFYPNKFEGKTRTVYLTGEANFKVVKDSSKPFIVRSCNMSVMALGTEFNVKAYPEDKLVAASLIEGKVKVSCNDTLNYILYPGEQVVFDKERCIADTNTVNMNDVTAWQRGEIVLSKVTVEEIVKTLERHFGVIFHVSKKNMNQDRYNFIFKEDASLQEVLEVMQIVVGRFNYQLKDNACYLNW